MSNILVKMFGMINRDLAIEIDGQRFQITKRNPHGDDQKTIERLKETRTNLRKALAELSTVADEIDIRHEFLNRKIANARRVLRDN